MQAASVTFVFSSTDSFGAVVVVVFAIIVVALAVVDLIDIALVAISLVSIESQLP